VKEAEGIVAWTNDYEGKAKVFGTTLGHNNETVADARFLNLVTRGCSGPSGSWTTSTSRRATRTWT
jgi:type 1 glutamine amidotransferase